MQDHRCTVEGCRAGRGRGCPHTTTRCATCRGPHGARADACAVKKEGGQAIHGWPGSTVGPEHASSRGGGDPLLTRAGRRGRGPEAPEYETPVAQGEKDEGEAEVEEREEGGPTQTAMETGE